MEGLLIIIILILLFGARSVLDIGQGILFAILAFVVLVMVGIFFSKLFSFIALGQWLDFLKFLLLGIITIPIGAFIIWVLNNNS